MKLVYIAGKYRDDSLRGIQQNIEKASNVAYKYWEKGYAVICPHKNTQFFDGRLPDETWLLGDLEILKGCDIIVMMDNYKTSVGALGELERAKELGLEIIYE